jgi:pyruvate dehydrogenase E2 component (dihydrolipoamide acetyltransferase)
MPNIEAKEKKDLSLFRRIAIGTWKTTYDPSVYGTIEVRMDRALEYIEAYRAATGLRLTVTHLLARAMGQVLHEHPDANALLRFNRIYLRERVAVFLQVASVDEETGRVDLSGVTLYDVHQKSLAEIIEEVDRRVKAVRRGSDPALERSRKVVARVPPIWRNALLRLVSFLSFDLNLDLRWAGMPRDPFGPVMITNIGSLGLDLAYVPLVPYSRVAILLATGAVRPVPVAVDEAVEIHQIMRINATFDHRFIDGVHAAAMSRLLRSWLEDPYLHFGDVSATSAP